MNHKTKRDFYAEITNAIIADLEKGVRPWTKPWDGGTSIPCRPLRITGEPYRGVNILLLWSAMQQNGYGSAHWLTFKQTRELGGHVRQGEKATMVVFAGNLTRTEMDDKGETQETVIPFLKAYSVFNIDQTEGLPEKFRSPAKSLPPTRDNQRIEPIERFVTQTNAHVSHGGDRAFYSLLEDRIQMPPLDLFHDSDGYYATLLHELTHWTIRDDRCPRKFRPSTFGTCNYAREELIAELGAAFLCSDLQISLTPRPDHAAYIANWLEVLRRDKRAVFQAAATAQRAADFLHSLQQPKPECRESTDLTEIAA